MSVSMCLVKAILDGGRDLTTDQREHRRQAWRQGRPTDACAALEPWQQAIS